MNAAGVNPNALTDIGPVFNIKNIPDHQRNATVWVAHDSDHIEFYVPGDGPVESEDEGVLLQPGDEVTVALLVDTRETDEITLDSFTVMANLDPDVTPTETETETESENIGGGGSSVDDDSDGSEDGGTEEPTADTETAPESTDTASGTATETSTPTPTTEPTPTEGTTNAGGTTPTEEPTDEQAGLGSSLLWILIVLAGLLVTMLLFRRFRGA